MSVEMIKSVFKMCLDAGMDLEDLKAYYSTDMKLTPEQYMKGEGKSEEMKEYLDDKFPVSKKRIKEAEEWTK